MSILAANCEQVVFIAICIAIAAGIITAHRRNQRLERRDAVWAIHAGTKETNRTSA